MILERVVDRLSRIDRAAFRLERVVLTSEQLAKHRQRAVTDAGREVGITLAHGTLLRDGDVLHLEDGLAIVVEQAEEDLLRVRPRTPEQFGVIAYEVGNLHRAAMIDAQSVTVLYEPAMEALARRLDAPFERVTAKFHPGGHRHSH